MNKWEVVGITETTKSNSQYSKNKFRYIFHIRNTISGKFHQYFLNKVHATSINVKCHSGKCKAILCLKIGNFKNVVLAKAANPKKSGVRGVGADTVILLKTEIRSFL